VNQVVQNGIVFAIGIGVGWFTHFYCVNIRERSSRLRVFRGFILTQILNWEAVDWKVLQPGQLFQLHQGTATPVASECAKILDDISGRVRARFDAARMAYATLKRQDVEPYGEYHPVHNPRAILHPDYERGRKRASDLLKAMREYAK